jgi:hypothetical protein
MKTKLAQLISFTNKIDRSHIQIAYFLLVLVGFIFTQSPSDGGTGPV